MFKKPVSYLGVDIGATSVKIVELTAKGGKPLLVNYGYSEAPSSHSPTDRLQLDVERSAAIVKEICRRAHLQAKSAVAAMPSYAVFSAVLTISSAGGTPEELEQAVLWEARKVVPLALEEMALDWQVMEGGEAAAARTAVPGKTAAKQAARYRVLLTGAPKNLVRKYVDIFKLAELRLVGLETEVFSLIRSLIGSDPSTVALVDLGAVNTDIAIIENGLPLFSRSLDAGGIMITKAIADSLHVDFKRAEQFKFDLSMATETAGTAAAIPSVLKSTLGPIVNEIKYSLNLFQQENNKKIDRIVLSGGGAHLVGVPQYLSELLNINVVVGDPWSRVAYPADLKPVLQEMGARMAIANGLALRPLIQ